MPVNGFQGYRRAEAQTVAPEAVGHMLSGATAGMPPEPPGVAADGEPGEHSPESTAAALAMAVGRSLARKKGTAPAGAFSMRQLRQLGVPDSEIMISRASGLVEGDD